MTNVGTGGPCLSCQAGRATTGYKELSFLGNFPRAPCVTHNRAPGKRIRNGGNPSVSKDHNYDNHEINPFAVGCTSGGGFRRGLVLRTLPSCASDEPRHARTGSRERAAFA